MADRKWWEKPVRVPVITYTDDNPFEAPDIDFDGTNVDEASEGVARVVWQQLQTSRNLKFNWDDFKVDGTKGTPLNGDEVEDDAARKLQGVGILTQRCHKDIIAATDANELALGLQAAGCV